MILLLRYMLLKCLFGMNGMFLLVNYSIELVVDLCEELVLIMLLM